MALVKYTAAVSEIRGKLNGNVFSRNTYGSYLRNKVTPINPQTADQIAVRSRITSASQAWAALTDGSRASFEGLAKQVSRKNIFGDEVKLTGFNLFMRLNANTLKAGGTLLTVAPADLSVTPLTAFTIGTLDAGPDFTITFAPTPVPAGTVLIVEATPPISAGISFVKPLYRTITVLAAATATGADVATPYQAKFGDIILGKKIFVRGRFVVVATGAESAVLSDSAIVAA